MATRSPRFDEFHPLHQAAIVGLFVALLGVWYLCVRFIYVTVNDGEYLPGSFVIGSVIAVIPCFMILATLGALWEAAQKPVRKRLLEEEQERQMAADRRRSDRERRQRDERRRQEVAQRVRDLPGVIVEAYRAAAESVERAGLWAEQANRHKSNGAFTPFWESIENSLVELRSHRGRVQDAKRLVEEFISKANDLEREGVVVVHPGTPGRASLPLGLDALGKLRVHDTVAHRIRELSYEAQRDPHFAMIYEQRRTTSAVYSGFNSVTHALAGLSAQISSLGMELSQAVHSASSDVIEAGSTYPLLANEHSLAGQVFQINNSLREIASAR